MGPWSATVWLVAVLQGVFCGALAWVYVGSGFTEEWSSYGYVLDWDQHHLLLSVCCVTGFAFLVGKPNSLDSAFAHLLIVWILSPTLVLWSCGGQDTGCAVASVLACGVSVVCSRIRLRVPWWPWNVAVQHVALACAALIFVTAMIAVQRIGVSNFSLDVTDVYEVRPEVVASTPTWLEYLIGLSGKVALPVVAVLALQARLIPVVLIVLMAGVALFGITSQKSYAFIAPLACATFWAAQAFRASPLRVLLVLSILVAGTLGVAYLSFGEGSPFRGMMIGSLTFRRAILVPAFLDFRFFELFGSGEEWNLWRTGRLGQLFGQGPSVIGPATAVGEVLAPGAGLKANAGFIGAGFAQAGFVGVAIYACGLGLYVSLLKAFVPRHGLPFVLAIGIYPVRCMSASADFLTALATHGGGAVVLVLWMLAVPNRGTGTHARRTPDPDRCARRSRAV